jgi:hypothetical protein
MNLKTGNFKIKIQRRVKNEKSQENLQDTWNSMPYHTTLTNTSLILKTKQ